jgi:hypothetical protein
MKLTLLAASLVLGAMTAQAQYVLDHFNCYQIQTTPPPGAVVNLVDQFNIPGLNVNVLNKIRFCNPTYKVVQGPVVTPITHPDDHLTFYRLSPRPPINLNVMVDNQFGPQQLLVTDPVLLAVPTQKSPHPNPPVDLDHYQCYIAAGQPVLKPAILADQFHRERVQVNTPILLCNPVRKEHNGAVTEIRHPDDHLVCYSKTLRQFANTRDIKNQFEASQIITIASDWLCVPSKKQIIGAAGAEE